MLDEGLNFLTDGYEKIRDCVFNKRFQIGEAVEIDTHDADLCAVWSQVFGAATILSLVLPTADQTFNINGVAWSPRIIPIRRENTLRLVASVAIVDATGCVALYRLRPCVKHIQL